MTITTIHELSADSKTLAAILNDAAVGDVVTYSTLTRAIGRDVQGVARGCLDMARTIAQRDNKIIFDAVRNMGLRRLSDSQIVDLGDKTRDTIRRASKRTMKKLVCVDYDAMPKEKQTKHNASISMLGTMVEMAKQSSFKRLESQVTETGTQIPFAKAAIAALGMK